MAQFTRQSLTDLIESMTESVGDNTVYWTATEKRDAINEAICMWQVMSGQWSSRVLITTADIFTRLPNNIVSIQRVGVLTRGADPETSPGTTLTMTSIPELDLAFPGWESEALATPRMWAPVGLNEIALYPPPPVVGVLLVVEGMTDAPRLFSDGDFIDLGEENLTELLRYAHHYLTFKEAGAEFMATQEDLIGLVESAGQQNARFKMTAPYRRYMGLPHEEAQRAPRGNPSLGVRTNE
jgi:hypothetical protein